MTSTGQGAGEEMDRVTRSRKIISHTATLDDVTSTGLRAGEETDKSDMEYEDHQSYRRP